MNDNLFDIEAELVDEALISEAGDKKLRDYIKPLVLSVAEKYQKKADEKGISREMVLEAGWRHYEIAKRKYQEGKDLAFEEGRETFLFSTYFTWYIRQGIVELLEMNQKGKV